MATHIELPQPDALPLRALVAPRRIAAGAEIGAAALVVFAAPVVVYDWVRSGHAALELPMAVTGWLFGLEHFVQNGYRWGPIALGAAILAVVWLVGGLAFGALADRAIGTKTLVASIVDGVIWGAAALLVAGVTVSLARSGAPFRATSTFDGYAAPGWVWAVAFLASGVAAGLGYFAVRGRATR